MSMFCYQCQEAAKGTGCTVRGVCGKNEEVAGLQDVLIHLCKSVSVAALAANPSEARRREAADFVIHSLFMSITNANFDDDAIAGQIEEGVALRDGLLGDAGLDAAIGEALHIRPVDRDAMERLAAQEDIGVLATKDPDVRSLRELALYGLKGMAAYAEHAATLGYRDEASETFLLEALAMTTEDEHQLPAWIDLVMRTGEHCVRVMKLLDEANTSSYGHPEITQVDLGVRGRPGILISGHDLKDLEMLLEQAEGSGVDVYTHGEMLPAQYYPAFKKYASFAGNYGNAWWRQKEEFESFRGPVLFTTNCIVPPKEEHIGRIYTTGSSGYPGCTHIEADASGEKDFTAIIEQAKTLPVPEALESGTLTGGFAHHQVEALLPQVLEAVRGGAIRKFFVMAGCDGRFKSRDYYTDFAKALPSDTVILTAGCAKYRYNKLDLGDIGGIPRVLGAGQCNDSYSLVAIALALKEALGVDDVNDLPIAYNIAWYEQKAVAVLLALLSLGVKNIHLGPTLPAFLSPQVADVLVREFGIAPIGSVEDDLALFLGE